jgi:hypothetical protein
MLADVVIGSADLASLLRIAGPSRRCAGNLSQTQSHSPVKFPTTPDLFAEYFSRNTHRCYNFDTNFRQERSACHNQLSVRRSNAAW